jgi:CheY-like chemotaxis protein
MSRALRILIVDDNRDCADSLAIVVRLWGHRPLVAYTGQAAVELATAQPPDVAILDLRMPLMSGYELARRLRDDPGLHDPVLVALTGEPENPDACAKSGFAYHLVKPDHLPALERLLRSVQSGRNA